MTRVLAFLFAASVTACSVASLDHLASGGGNDAGPDTSAGAGGTEAGTDAGSGGAAGGSAGTDAGSGGAAGGSAGTGALDGATQGVTCSNSPTPCTVPPPPSAQPPNTSGSTTVIAMSRVFLGDTDHQGNKSATAWKSFGYNLDDLVSRSTDENHCALASGASPTVKDDGDGGIDNSFGANLVPLMQSMQSDIAASSNQAISDGSYTEMVKLDNFLAPAQAPDQNGVDGALYAGSKLGSAPAFDGTDVWPPTYESVVNGDVNAPVVTFPNSYVAGARWVSGDRTDLTLPLYMSGQFIFLPITGAVVTMRVQGTGVSASAVEGTIAGVLDTEAFIKEFERVAILLVPSLCNSSTLDAFANQIRNASDIMLDGTNGNPGKHCNGISIGIGFDGFGVKLGAVAAAKALPAPACSSAN